jgi:hypothetical protein
VFREEPAANSFNVNMSQQNQQKSLAMSKGNPTAERNINSQQMIPIKRMINNQKMRSEMDIGRNQQSGLGLGGYYHKPPTSIGQFSNMNVGSLKHMRSGFNMGSYGSKQNQVVQAPSDNKNLVPPSLQKFENDENDQKYFEEE